MNFASEYDNPINLRTGAWIVERGHLREQAFHHMISLERRRAERASKAFLLMLVEIGDHQNRVSTLRKILAAMPPVTRETDLSGWYRENVVVGVMFTEVSREDLSTITATIMSRINRELGNRLTPRELQYVRISFQLLPKAADYEAASPDFDPVAHQTVSVSQLAAESSF